MKKLIKIPTTIDIKTDLDNLMIDMSNLEFDVPDNKKKFYAFIFIRNTGIKAELNFDNCSYEDKEEYLLMFLTTNVELKCPILASTWIEILSYDGNNLSHQSILNKDEIKKFIERNIEFIDNIHQFINSLPVYAIYTFHGIGESPMNMDEFETTDYDKIKLANFYQITTFDTFGLLLNHNPSYAHRPMFYNKLFTDNENKYDFMRIMDNLPYINILRAMFSSTELQSDIIDNITTLLEEGSNE